MKSHAYFDIIYWNTILNPIGTLHTLQPCTSLQIQISRLQNGYTCFTRILFPSLIGRHVEIVDAS